MCAVSRIWANIALIEGMMMMRTRRNLEEHLPVPFYKINQMSAGRMLLV
jgi:hypothetical protein